MFCPTAVDAYFGKKLSHLDLTFSKTSSYQERVSFEERVKEAEDTRSRYPNKIPLVIEKHKADKYLQDIDKVATHGIMGSPQPMSQWRPLAKILGVA